MKTLKNILFSILLLIPLLAAGQENFEVQWSKWYDHESTVTPKSYFGCDSSGYYGILETYTNLAARQKPQDLAFFKLDLKGEFVFTKKIELKYKEKAIRLFRTYNIGGNYFLIGSYLAEDKKTFIILTYAIDKKGNLSAPKELLTLPTFDEGVYDYNCYQDKDLSTFYVWVPNGEKDLGKRAFSIFAFDLLLKPLWTKEFKSPADEFHKVERMIFTKDKLYVLTLVPRNLEIKRLAKYKLSSYDFKTYQSAHETITLTTGTTANCYMDLDAQNNPVLSGFYVKEIRFKYDSKLLDGFFCMKYDFKSGNQIFSVQQEFPYEVLTEFFPEKKAKLGGPLLQDLDVRSINVREDGSIYVVSEHSAFVNSGDHIYFNYQNLIVTSISNQGNVEWFKTIPKPKQSSIMLDNIRFYSYIQGSTKEHVYFLYNENYDNPNRPKTIDHAGLINCNDAITALATLDRKGNLTRQTVFKENNPKNKTCIEPINSMKIDESTFILFLTSGKDAKVGLFKLKK